MKKRALALCLALCLTLALSACAPAAPTVTPTLTPTPTPTATATPTPVAKEAVRLALLNGPTGMGAVKLMADNELAATQNDYAVTIAVDNSEVAALLAKGDIDIAAMASNMAANLYSKTDKGIQTIALGTLGVLYILENGDTVSSLNSLAGRTLYATGQGANPEYVLRYLLEENGLELGADVNVEWRTPEEISALMATGDATLCMLPIPAATAVLAKNPKVRQALDLTAEWTALKNDSQLIMTSVVVRRAFAEEHPAAVTAFLEEYAASIEYVNREVDAASELVARFGITPSAAIAKAAIPKANLVCITGEEMRPAIQTYYEVLFAANPKSVGGTLPDDGFYYQP